MIPSCYRRMLSNRTHRLDTVGMVSLTIGNIYIFPELNGLGFGLMALIMMVGFLNFALNPAIFVSCLLAALLWVTLIHTHRNLIGLRLQSLPVAPVFAGEQAAIAVLLQEVDHRCRHALHLGGWDRNMVSEPVDLDAGASAAMTLFVPTRARGLLDPGTLTLYSRFPLGLIRVWTHMELNHPILVYPRPEATTTNPLFQEETTPGEVSGRLMGDDFLGLEPWRPGDPPSAIHWKGGIDRTARLAKRFGGHGSGRTWLRWEDTQLADGEAALSRLSRWVLEAEAGNSPYGLKLPGVTIPPGLGQAHAHQCLAALTRFEIPGEGSMRSTH
ncbi:MAG: hypothetical protein HQL73_02905 [Magnetococcales bacterium]|nr:hypothetical protein [Magnetococcales bacterium]